MSMQAKFALFITAVGGDIKSLLTTRGTMAGLATTEKGTLVGAINEVRTLAQGAGGGAAINDSTTAAGTTWSSNKVAAEVAAAISALRNGVGAGFDTLIELSNELSSQDTALDNLLTAVGNRVRFDAVQGLNTAQQAQAAANIGIGDPETDLVALYNAAKA